MTENPFQRLAPFIQEYIYRNKWEELRDIQVGACQAVFDTDDHLILSSGTASGKTEAAFFPILSKLVEEPSRTVGILYIGPLKALINDQFERLKDLLEEAYIPVWHWHGDVARSEKMRLLKSPSGILQITPESLEALLMNRPAEVVKLFSDLKYVIIDEVHAFFGTDRGSQVLCQLSRVQQLAGCDPRRIGLSATISDLDSAERWIASGTNRKVSVVRGGGRHRARLAVEHFGIDAKEGKDQADLEKFNEYLYDHCSKKKCLIFANSRGDTEKTIQSMKNIAAKRGEPNVFYVHHGSVSAALREEAESALRENAGPTVSAATLTLELGIDIGDLERIVQIGSPWSCSSFVQRLGRSGRKTNTSEMWFVHKESRSDRDGPLEQIPWGLLQNIAIIELYKNDHWVEPFRLKERPYSLLYHQIMSIMSSRGELTPKELAEQVLSLPPFTSVDSRDLRVLLNHLISEDHLQWTDEGTLLLGLKGERITGNYHFYSVFPDADDYVVLDQTREIGSLSYPPPVGEAFLLAGRTWRVTEVDKEGKRIYVSVIRGKASSAWEGGSGNVDLRVVKGMRNVLANDEAYLYLQPGALTRLDEARRVCKKIGLLDSCVHELGDNRLALTPWVGTREMRTISRILVHGLKEELEIDKVEEFFPYYMKVGTSLPVAVFTERLRDRCQTGIDASSLMDAEERALTDKYDLYLPPELTRRAFVANELDIDGTLNELRATL